MSPISSIRNFAQRHPKTTRFLKAATSAGLMVWSANGHTALPESLAIYAGKGEIPLVSDPLSPTAYTSATAEWRKHTRNFIINWIENYCKTGRVYVNGLPKNSTQEVHDSLVPYIRAGEAVNGKADCRDSSNATLLNSNTVSVIRQSKGLSINDPLMTIFEASTGEKMQEWVQYPNALKATVADTGTGISITDPATLTGQYSFKVDGTAPVEPPSTEEIQPPIEQPPVITPPATGEEVPPAGEIVQTPLTPPSTSTEYEGITRLPNFTNPSVYEVNIGYGEVIYVLPATSTNPHGGVYYAEKGSLDNPYPSVITITPRENGTWNAHGVSIPAGINANATPITSETISKIGKSQIQISACENSMTETAQLRSQIESLTNQINRLNDALNQANSDLETVQQNLENATRN